MRSLFYLSGSIFLFCLPFVFLLAVGPGVAFLLFLTGHDINYYLTYRPPEFCMDDCDRRVVGSCLSCA